MADNYHLHIYFTLNYREPSVARFLQGYNAYTLDYEQALAVCSQVIIQRICVFKLKAHVLALKTAPTENTNPPPKLPKPHP